MSTFASTVDDHRWMAHALVLARRGLGLTDPNPTVGCVIVRDGHSVGEGTTARAGGPHAEITALAAAGGDAAGATAYVSLEPCCHHGRTGPCTDALIEAGIGRVVAAMLDPDPRVGGNGMAALAAAGIEVAHGLLEDSARTVNPGYFSRMVRGRPWVRVKIAASLDGRTALANGSSQWITGEPARADVHRWRARSSAILTGIGTVLADDPALTARPAEDIAFMPPVKVVADSALRVPPAARLFASGDDVILFCTDSSARAARALERPNVRIEAMGGTGRVDPGRMLESLSGFEINTVWVEAGATLSGALLAAGLADELIVYMAPDLLGSSARGMAEFGPLATLSEKVSLEISDVRRLGRDLRIMARPSTLPDR